MSCACLAPGRGRPWRAAVAGRDRIRRRVCLAHVGMARRRGHRHGGPRRAGDDATQPAGMAHLSGGRAIRPETPNRCPRWLGGAVGRPAVTEGDAVDGVFGTARGTHEGLARGRSVDAGLPGPVSHRRPMPLRPIAAAVREATRARETWSAAAGTARRGASAHAHAARGGGRC